MSPRTLIFCGGGVLIAGMCVGVFLVPHRPSTGVPPRTGVVPQGSTTQHRYTPAEFLDALTSGTLDQQGDRVALRAVIDGMDQDTRGQFMRQLAQVVGALDPRVHGGIQRRMGFFALEQGRVNDGWTMLKAVVDCRDCAEGDHNDAIRLLDQFTPADDERRAALDALVIQRAEEVLSSGARNTQPLPLVWSAIDRLRAAGRVADAVSMQERYLVQFSSVVDRATLLPTLRSLAQDLAAVGRTSDARRLFMEVADADGGPTMSLARASALVHAARAGSAAEAIPLLEGALSNPGQSPSAASALLFFELMQAYRTTGQPASAAAVAARYWQTRAANANTLEAPPDRDAPGTAEAQAMICYQAAEAARQQGQSAEATMWLRRVLEVAPQSTTAEAVRRELAQRTPQ